MNAIIQTVEMCSRSTANMSLILMLRQLNVLPNKTKTAQDVPKEALSSVRSVVGTSGPVVSLPVLPP